jgi:hypothetical protein
MDALDHFTDLPTYADYRPTRHDTPGLGLPDRATWRVLPVMQTRDSGPLDRSNFRVMLADLTRLDPDGAHHETHRFGHWGPGWFEIILVSPDAPDTVLRAAGEAACSLADYPILSEDDYSTLEYDTAAEAWAGFGLRDRIATCARYRVSIFAARRDDVPDSPTGELVSYLAGS